MKVIQLDPNLIKCETCGKYFDPASLKEVFEHEHNDHTLKDDIKGKKK